MRDNDMGYFEAVGAEVAAEWNDFRDKIQAWRAAIQDLAKDIGAERYNASRNGQLEVAVFTSEVHAGFTKKPNKHGAHCLREFARPKKLTAAEADGVAFMKARNETLAAMYPSANEIATRHGFISDVSWKSSSDGWGGGGIGHIFNPFQPTWSAKDSTIILFAADPRPTIARHLSEGREVTPASWSVPAGYVEVMAEEYEFRHAAAKLRSAKLRAAGVELDHDD